MGDAVSLDSDAIRRLRAADAAQDLLMPDLFDAPPRGASQNGAPQRPAQAVLEWTIDDVAQWLEKVVLGVGGWAGLGVGGWVEGLEVGWVSGFGVLGFGFYV